MAINANKIAQVEACITGEADAVLNASERRFELGKALHAAGFCVDTDYAGKAAKDADRADMFGELKRLAAFYLPTEVRLALHDTEFPGARRIPRVKPYQSKTEWTKRIPAKLRDLMNAQRDWEIAAGKRAAPEAAAPSNKTVTQRVADHIKAIKTILAGDTDKRLEAIDVDVDAMTTALGLFKSATTQAHEQFVQAAQENATRGDEPNH